MREKWHTGNLPPGYPIRCSTEQLQDAVQDLSDEYYTKTQAGKLNVTWEKLILNLMESGRKELGQRVQANQKRIHLFSMDNPLIYVLVALLLAIVAYLAMKLGLPFKLS